MRRLTTVVGAIVLMTIGIIQPAVAHSARHAAADVAVTAAVDVDALNRQAEWLRAVEQTNPHSAGGTYFDEATGQMVVRYVDNAGGTALRNSIASMVEQPGAAPIRYERTNVPIATLRAAVQKLNSTRAWAGSAAGRFHQARLNVLTAEVTIDVSGDAERLVAAADRATGITPRAEISESGIVAQSRRHDDQLLNGGLAIWNTCATATPAVGCPADVNGNAWCTTGFRMTRGGANSGFMTTAGHCGGNGTVFWHGERAVARVSSNYSTSGTTGVDISLLGLVNASDAFSREVWFGGRNATETVPVSAKNTTWPVIGSSVFISGANSGLLRATVTDVGVECRDLFGNLLVEGPMIQVATEGGFTVGGDSGAPVFAYNSLTPAADDVRAVGSNSCGNGSSASLITPIHRIESVSGSVVVIGGN
jgi:hypothetical protein